MPAHLPVQPLSGYRILDLTVMTAGPVGTMILGDTGADVIKIEELEAGELSRGMGTVYVGSESANFLSQNRNKRSVRLDLKSSRGRATFLKMAAGVLTPTEVETALGHGADAAKLFPASLGGVDYLKALRAPFPDVPFVPVGGVDETSVPQYLAAGAVAVGVGSPLVADAAHGGDLGALADRARRFLALVAETG